METASREYLSCAETAKLVRKALKKDFPSTKFSVRSNTYAGGASIDVGYTDDGDGPNEKAVKQTVDQFEGSGFDGMIDLKFRFEHYLMPDGTTITRRLYGHSYNDETFVEEAPEGARLVSFGADYVFVNRRITDSFKERLQRELEEITGEPFDGFRRYYNFAYKGKVIDGYGDSVVYQMSHA